MPDLFGQTQSFDRFVNITQVWSGSTPSLTGSVSFVQSSQIEFYNGELSGSVIVAETGDLSDCNVELLTVYNNASLGTVQAAVSTGYDGPTLKIPYDVNIDNVYYLTFSYSNLDIGFGITVVDNTGKTFLTINRGALDPSSGTINTVQISNPEFPLGFKTTDTIGGCSITNITLFESYIEPDCLVVANDVGANRPSSKYMDVDFNESQILAINQQVILSGSATKATVPDSNYSPETGFANARYYGSEYTGQYNYTASFASQSFPRGYPIDNFSKYFMYFDWIGGSDPQYPGGGNIHGVYLIDTDANVISLSVNNYNLFITETTFVGGQTAYIYPAVYSSGKPVVIATNIVDGGALYETILVVTGSGLTQIQSLTDQSYNLVYEVYFTGSNSTLTDSGSTSTPVTSGSWIYAFTNPSSSNGIIQSFYVGSPGVSIRNTVTDQLINLNSSPNIINYSDTMFPLQYGDMIRFGTTGSYSITNTSSLDGTFTAGGLFQIASIITGSTMTVSSSINIVPSLTAFPFSNNAIKAKNTQNFRMIRRSPNESFVLIQNKPQYLDPGFLVPFNFDPRYNIYDLARRAGIIQ